MSLGIVIQDKTQFTVEEIQERFPSKKNTITEEAVALINEANSNPMFNGDEFISTMIDYQGAMIDCSASIPEYINAVRFCAYLETEKGNLTEAYINARAGDDFVKKRLPAEPNTPNYNALASAASRYRKTPLVKQILTQSHMSLYLMFQGATYKAVAVLANEMTTAQYSKDRISAADKLLSHVKPPENINVELSVGPNKEAKDTMFELNTQLAQLAISQKAMLDAGKSIKDVQKTKVDLTIMEAEVLG